MEELDDDFGDLYADVEVQASYAINTEVQPSYAVNTVHENSDDNFGNCIDNAFTMMPKNVDALRNNCNFAPPEAGEEKVDDGGKSSESEDELNIVLNNDDDDDDESEDELNIALNDDDDTEVGKNGVMSGEMNKSAFGVNDDVGNGSWVDYKGNEEIEDETGQNSSGGKIFSGYSSQFKNTRFQTPVSSNGFLGVASNSSKLVQDKSKDDGYTHYLNASSLASQSKCSFSLPRSRTIFDVNIDSLKHKPWKHPGVDITDFFNFGFNEDSWKQYCNILDTLRHQTSDGRYMYKSSRHNKELKAGTEHEEVAHKVGFERISQPVQLQSGMINGKAIQVEECVSERQPSRNIWGPLDRDSDVVIQIALQDDLKDDRIDSASEGVDRTDVDYEDTLLDEAREILCLSAGEDELSSLEGDDEISGNYAAESDRSDKQSPRSGFISKHLDADVVYQGKWTDAAQITEKMGTFTELGGSAGRRLSNAAPSVLKPHMRQGDQSPHSVTPPRSHSHSDYGFDTYADLRKLSNKSKLNSPNYLHKKRDSVTYDCYLSDDSKNRALQPVLSCPGKKPIYMDDDDGSHLSSKEWFDDSWHSTIYHKHNGLDSHAGRRNSYYKANSFPDGGVHKLSNCDSRDRYMKRPHWKRSCSEYDSDQNNSENNNGKKRHVEQRPRLDHKEGRQGRLFNERRHALQCMESQRHGQFRQWQPKSDCYLENEAGNQWKTAKHDWQFRNDIEDDDLLVQSNYENNLVQGNLRKPASSVVDFQDSVHHTGNKHLSYSRREVESSGWSSLRCDQAFDGLDDMQYTEYDEEKGGCTRFCSRDSQNKPRSTCRQRLQGGSSPRDGMDQTHSKNRRNSSWTEKSYDNDNLGDCYLLDADVKMRNVDNQDCFGRIRDKEQCGVSRWDEELYKSIDNEVLPSGSSYPYKREQSRGSIDSEHGLNRVGKHMNHKKAMRGRFRKTRGHSRGQFFQNSNVFRSGNNGNAHPQFKSSNDLHLVGVDRKYSGRSSRGSKRCNARNEYIDKNCIKLKTFDDSNVYYPVNGIYSKNLEVDQHCQFSNVEDDIEEGQILSEELKDRAKEEINSSEDLGQIGGNKNLYCNHASDGNEAFKEHENPRIREILEKMERRRERFKRPIILKKDMEKATPMALHTNVETCKSNPQRPARKRRWDGTQHMLSLLT